MREITSIRLLKTGFVVSAVMLSAHPAYCQVVQNSQLAPISLRNDLQIAQLAPRPSVPNPTIIPTDVTPIGIGQEREMVRPGPTYYLLQKLPPKMWFNGSVEASQRLETNVFFTTNNPRQDYVFRVQPNLTLGYKFLPRTSVYANWFLIKDVFAVNNVLTSPTFQSVSGGLQHDIPIKSRSNLQFNYQIRELWQNAGLRQADMIPGVTFTHAFTPKFIGFTNLQLQMRSRNIFQGPTREMDPFYTVGALYRWKSWVFLATNTFVTNFRQLDAIPPQSNFAMIADFEASRPILKRYPNVQAFVRAEPIWNWHSNRTPGLSGFDFRLFTGIRLTASKSAYEANLSKMRRMLQEEDSSTRTPAPKKKVPTGNSNSNKSQVPQSSTADPTTSSPTTRNDASTTEKPESTDPSSVNLRGVLQPNSTEPAPSPASSNP